MRRPPRQPPSPASQPIAASCTSASPARDAHRDSCRRRSSSASSLSTAISTCPSMVAPRQLTPAARTLVEAACRALPSAHAVAQSAPAAASATRLVATWKAWKGSPCSAPRRWPACRLSRSAPCRTPSRKPTAARGASTRPSKRSRGDAAARAGGRRMRALTFGFSPCPNDTFAFHALVHGLVDAPFRVAAGASRHRGAEPPRARRRVRPARSSASAPSPASGARYRHAAQRRRPGPRRRAARRGARAAATRRRRPRPHRHSRTRHDGVPAAALAAPASARSSRCATTASSAPSSGATSTPGLIIHESRFTYAGPRPHEGRRPRRVVGGETRPAGPAGRHLRARRSRPDAGRGGWSGRFARRWRHAFAHPEASRAYVRAHAQEMSDEVCDAHIRLYVNEFSLDVGDEGLQRHPTAGRVSPPTPSRPDAAAASADRRMSSKITDTILDTIGHTPMVRSTASPRAWSLPRSSPRSRPSTPATGSRTGWP